MRLNPCHRIIKTPLNHRHAVIFALIGDAALTGKILIRVTNTVYKNNMPSENQSCVKERFTRGAKFNIRALSFPVLLYLSGLIRAQIGLQLFFRVRAFIFGFGYVSGLKNSARLQLCGGWPTLGYSRFQTPSLHTTLVR